MSSWSYVKRLINYLESVIDLDTNTLQTLITECQEASQLDNTFEGVTALCVACSTECEEAVMLLLRAGANVNLSSGYFERTPLHYCLDFEDHYDESVSLSICKLLIEHGANINRQDKSDYTPLHLACMYKNNKCAELLISYGAKLNETDVHYETPLIKACKSFAYEIVENLLDAGCDINHDYGAALKFLLLSFCPSKVVQLLVNKGANLNLRNYLCTACCAGRSIKEIEFLIQRGAKVNSIGNVLSIRALHQACISRKVGHEVVELLLQYGADINSISDTGDSALHYACQAVNLKKVLILLNWGADLRLIDDCQYTALGALLTTRVEEGLFSDYIRIANLMLAAGASLSDLELDMLRKQIPVPLSPSQTEENISKFLDHLKSQCKEPSKLLDLCRIKIRDTISGIKDEVIQELVLPKYLKDFLLFSDVCVVK